MRATVGFMLTGEILRRSARRFPAKPALIWGVETVTYGALDAAADRFAHALVAAGLEVGDRVAIVCGNRPEYAATYFGVARAGAVSVHLSPRYTGDELRHTLMLTGARAAVVEAPLDTTVGGLAGDLPGLEPVVVVGEGTAPDSVPWAAFVDGRPGHDPGLALDAGAPASITFTGGTTGMPKGAVVTHAGRSHWARVAVHDFRLEESEVAMIAAPLYHAAGGFCWFQPAILAGATCVMLGHWDVPGFIDAIERHGGTGAFLVPTQIDMLIEDAAFDRGRLGTLRKIVYGGAPSRPALIARAEAALPEVEFIQNFGQSETGPLITLYEEDRRCKPAALGRASPLVEAAIFTAPGRRAAPGEIGQICARGVHVMRGYIGDAAETAAFFRGGDGWGWTGDLAYADEGGLITLVDRAKDMIIAGGVNIYPAEIETVLADHPAVADCAVFGLPDDRWGELPAAAVVPADGTAVAHDADALAAALAAHCAGRIARHKRPRRIEIVDTLPRSAGGKILRSVLRERYAATAAAKP